MLPFVILMWSATFFYAMAESGYLLISHQKLSTVGALLGKAPTTPGGTPASGPGAPVPHGSIAAAIVAYATSALQTPYGWGQPARCTPTPKAYDCSGLTRCAVLFATNGGLSLAHNTVLQQQALRAYRVNKNNPAAWQPGDLIYYFIASEINQGEPAHCAIYIGGGKVIDAPHTGTRVRIDNYNLGPITSVCRPALWQPKASARKPARSTAAGSAQGAPA